ncbi:RNA polymerase sigma factor [Anaerobacillus alkaliphilus]|nr:RNA polymerase sigma factor [Anaerobacillus alkaliphilus]
MNITQEKASELYAEYSPYIHRTALLLTKSLALADDITQEVFLQVFKKFEQYDQSKPIKPWLYTITVNTTRNFLRKQKWLSFVGILPEKNGAWLEETILKTEEEKELWMEIQKLNQNHKEIIVLHFYSGLKLQEIADILQIPLGTCKSRYHAALTALRKVYKPATKGENLYEII